MATTENLHEGDGTKTNFSFTFPYQKQSDIEVYVFVTDDWVQQTITTEYKFADATHIEFLSGSVPADIVAGSAEEALLGGTQNVKIKRNTPTDKLIATFYPGSAIRSADLNDNFTQNLYVTEEADEASTVTSKTVEALVGVTNDEGTTYVTQGDGVGSNPKGVKYAVTTADAASDTADLAKDSADDAIAATNTLVATNTAAAGDPPVWVLQGGGAPDGQPEGVKYAVDTAVEADNIADQAKDSADDAIAATNALVATNSGTDSAPVWVLQGDGSNTTTNNKGVAYAVQKADDAVADATAALNNSQDLTATPSAAIDIAQAAEIDANTAKTATDTYVAIGSVLQGDGQGSNPKGVAYAVNLAEEASASVAASAIYKVVADLSTLTTDYPLTGNQPSPPGADPLNLVPTPDGTYVQITDSTDISYDGTNWTTDFSGGATSFPNGFSGHSQLTLRVKVSNASAGSESYIVQEYYANDPEARYGEDRKIVIENERTLSQSYAIQTTMNALSVGPISIDSGVTLTIPENSKYVVLN
jgi:hypothetical protein